MPDSKREAALKALYGVLKTIPGATVVRNEPEITAIPVDGLVVLRDGDPGDPDVFLSPTAYAYEHRAEVVVQIHHADGKTRDREMDVLLQRIGAAIAADATLGCAVDMALPAAPDLIDEPVEGAAAIKAALVPVFLEYVTSSPLG